MRFSSSVCGEAGKYLALTMAKAGRIMVVVERGLIGLPLIVIIRW